MKKENFLNAIKSLRKNSEKRKFDQTLDLIVNLKEVDKKNSFDAYLTMPHSTGKSVKICAIVDSEYEKQAGALTDKVVTKEELAKLQSKDVSKLAKGYDIFLAQASLMWQIAGALGKTLGPLGKMPNPKTGGVLMPGADIKSTVERFRKNRRGQMQTCFRLYRRILERTHAPSP